VLSLADFFSASQKQRVQKHLVTAAKSDRYALIEVCCIAYSFRGREAALGERWWRRRKRRLTWFSDLKDDSDCRMKCPDPNANWTEASGFSKNSRSESNSDRKPHLRKVEPLKLGFQKPHLQEDPEPLVDVIEEDDAVVVVAGLLGVRKEDLQIHAAHCSLTISLDTSERKYYRELALPAATDPESAVATFKHGVLHVRLKKLIVDAQPLTE